MNFNDNFYKQKNYCKHSIYLQKEFSISILGVDYYNKSGIGFEFKETFSDTPDNRKKFLVRQKDLESDYIIFSDNNKMFYICDSIFLEKYEFKNKNKIAQPYLSTIKIEAIKRFDNIKELKKYIESIN